MHKVSACEFSPISMLHFFVLEESCNVFFGATSQIFIEQLSFCTFDRAHETIQKRSMLSCYWRLTKTMGLSVVYVSYSGCI